MKKFLAIIAFLPLIIIGCGIESQTDEDAIKDIVLTSDWFNLTRAQENDSTVANQGSKGDTLTNPRWWRAITDRKKEIDVDKNGDSAYVKVTLRNTGKFNVLSFEDSIFVKKPLKETLRMDAIFLRTGDASGKNKGWQLKKLTGVTGSSDETHTVRIDSVRIQCASYSDTVLTSPLETFFDTANVMKFAPAESITVTLYTNICDGDAFLHVFQHISPWHYRIPMKNLGGGIYTNETPWHVQWIPTVRLAVFDFLRHGTIYDTEYPYDFDGWLYPYVVK